MNIDFRFDNLCDELSKVKVYDNIGFQDGRLFVNPQGEDILPVDKKMLKVLLCCFKEHVTLKLLDKCTHALVHLTAYCILRDDKKALKKLIRGVGAVFEASRLNSKKLDQHHSSSCEKEKEASTLPLLSTQNEEEDTALIQAAEKKYYNSLNELATSYLYGKGIKQNASKAIEILEILAPIDSYAMFLLGSCYFHGGYVEKDEAKGMDILNKAAEAKNTQALCFLSTLHVSSGHADRAREAFRLVKLAADQNCAQAFSMLGLYYKLGIGVPSDIIQARYFYEMGASLSVSKNDIIAQFELAKFNLNSIEKENQIKGFNLMLEVANQGYIYAQQSVYFHLFHKDPKAAIERLAFDTAGKNPWAMLKLAEYYEQRLQGLEEDHAKAASLVLQAKRLNEPTSQND